MLWTEWKWFDRGGGGNKGFRKGEKSGKNVTIAKKLNEIKSYWQEWNFSHPPGEQTFSDDT